MSPDFCESRLWIGGRIMCTLSIMAMFISVSIHLGTKKFRATIPKPATRGVFILAQCSAVAVAAFGANPSLAALVAGMLTQQFGTEPHWVMGVSVLKKRQTWNARDCLKLLLILGVFAHHFCIIILPLFTPCLTQEALDNLPLFLAGCVVLGTIAGLYSSNLVRAATDTAAIGLYWISLYAVDLGTDSQSFGFSW